MTSRTSENFVSEIPQGASMDKIAAAGLLPCKTFLLFSVSVKASTLRAVHFIGQRHCLDLQF